MPEFDANAFSAVDTFFGVSEKETTNSTTTATASATASATSSSASKPHKRLGIGAARIKAADSKHHETDEELNKKINHA